MTLSLDKFVQRCLNLTMAMLIRVILTANAAWEPTINIINVDTAQSSTEFRLGPLAEVYDISNTKVKEPCIRYSFKGWGGMRG
jgi:hypothetical protein